MRHLFGGLLLLALAAGAAAQEDPFPSYPDVDQGRVREAIRKGVEYLKAADLAIVAKPEFDMGYGNNNEIVLWTFLHAHVPEDDPKFQQVLAGVLASPNEKTYKVSLKAMCLEELDRVKYQGEIYKCGQFLIDNQTKTGQFHYGSPVDAVKDVASAPPRKGKEAEGPKKDLFGRRLKPKVTRKLPLKRSRALPAGTGDSSNSQYAALGLRACHDAGVLIPEDVVVLAVKSWRETQHATPPAKGAKGSSSAKGWNYAYDNDPGPPYLAMTAGGVGSLVIYDYMAGRDWKRSVSVKAGLQWIDENYSVAVTNGWWSYYYLYGLERAGILYGTEKIGTHLWYPDGAKVLLDLQRPDGSWDGADPDRPFATVWSTCFAVLFLQRATRPLEDVATGVAETPKK